MRAVVANLSIVALLAVPLFIPSAPVRSEELQGLLAMGHEVRSLQPCGDDRTLWLKLRGALRQELEAAVRRLTTQPYEAVYAELDGWPAKTPADGFAADYDGVFEVTEIRHVSKAGVDACRLQRLMARHRTTAVDGLRTYVFVCSDHLAVTVRASTTEAWLFHPGGTRRLTAMPAGRGNGYSDGVFELRIEGEQARLGETGGPYRSCRNDPRRAVWEQAKLDGADFRAVGNEPGWSLEIRQGRRMVLLADYGATRIELPLPAPELDRTARRTRWDAGEIILEVIGRPCRDTMSGESFDAEVFVYWQGRALRGCGRALH
jgi:putative lipoprotein